MPYDYSPTAGAKLLDADGNTIWSSAREQMYITDYVTGSFVIPRLPILTTGVIDKDIINVAAVSANATDLLGWFTATQSGGYNAGGVANGGVHQLGGTTLLMSAQFNCYPSNSGVPDYQYKTWIQGAITDLAGALLLSTYVSGGFLKAEIERYMPTSGDFPSAWNALGQNNVTITYHAFAVTFDN